VGDEEHAIADAMWRHHEQPGPGDSPRHK
jgi:hypothetical protein